MGRMHTCVLLLSHHKISLSPLVRDSAAFVSVPTFTNRVPAYIFSVLKIHPTVAV